MAQTAIQLDAKAEPTVIEVFATLEVQNLQLRATTGGNIDLGALNIYDYDKLSHKPKINGTVVEGEKSLKDYGIPQEVERQINEHNVNPEAHSNLRPEKNEVKNALETDKPPAHDKFVDTATGLPEVKDFINKQASAVDLKLTGKPTDLYTELTIYGVRNRADKWKDDLTGNDTDDVGALTLHGLSNRITNEIDNLDSEATAEQGHALTKIVMENGKIVSHEDMDLNSNVLAEDGTVLTGLVIVGGKVVSHSVKGNATQESNGLMSAPDKKKLDGFTDAAQYAKLSDLNNLYRYRGSVATEDDLPIMKPIAGDVYSIEARSSYGEAGTNVAWVDDPNGGGHWDNLGSILRVDTATYDEVLAILEAND